MAKLAVGWSYRVADAMTEHGLRDLVRCGGRFRNPVTQRRAETVRSLFHASVLHQARHGCIRDDALPHRREQSSVSGERFCLLDDAQRLGRERDAEILSLSLSSLHVLRRNGPDIPLNLFDADEAHRDRANAG